MNLLFIADIHIILGQKNIPTDWAKGRFASFVEQVARMQNQADIVILGGDIFDRLPSNMDEIALFFDLVTIFTKPTYIYSGNHEALKKSTTFLTSFKKAVNRLNNNVHILDDFHSICDGIVDIIPYNKLRAPFPETLKGKILCTHVRGEIPPHVKSEIDLDIFNKWDIVLAGDLHSYDNCQRNILYPGSPYTTSFHRQKVKTGAILLNTDDLSHIWLEFKLPQLLKLSVGVNDPKPQNEYDHIIYEIEGNLEDLSKIEDNNLVSKKLIKRTSESSLILSTGMTLIEEMKEYYEYILLLPDETIDPIIKEFLNHSDKLDL